MSTPARFLHTETGGFSPTLLKMLPIRQNINRLTSLNRTLRAVLIEVVELAENGKQKAFTGSNDYLSERIGGTVRTITRALSELQRLDLVVSTGATKLRRIQPALSLRFCYTGSEAEQFAAVEKLNADLEILKECKMSIDILPTKEGLSIDNQGAVYRQSGSCLQTSVVMSIDKQGSVYKETTNNDQYTTNECLLASARAELAEAQKEITILKSSLEEMTHQRDQLRASLKAQRPASHTQGAGGGHADPLHFVSFARSTYAELEAFAALLIRLGYTSAFAPYYLAQITTKTASLDERTPEGWQAYINRFLHNDASNGRLQISDPNQQPTHGNAAITSRPTPGQKPTGNAGQLARSLAERRERN